MNHSSNKSNFRGISIPIMGTIIALGTFLSFYTQWNQERTMEHTKDSLERVNFINQRQIILLQDSIINYLTGGTSKVRLLLAINTQKSNDINLTHLYFDVELLGVYPLRFVKTSTVDGYKYMMKQKGIFYERDGATYLDGKPTQKDLENYSPNYEKEIGFLRRNKSYPFHTSSFSEKLLGNIPLWFLITVRWDGGDMDYKLFLSHSDDTVKVDSVQVKINGYSIKEPYKYFSASYPKNVNVK